MQRTSLSADNLGTKEDVVINLLQEELEKPENSDIIIPMPPSLQGKRHLPTFEIIANSTERKTSSKNGIGKACLKGLAGFLFLYIALIISNIDH